MNEVILLDGAMGSELIKRGEYLPPYIWSADSNLKNPDLVAQIHTDYINAGSNYITTNTFRTTPRAFKKTGLCTKDAESVAYKALQSALQSAILAAQENVSILASIAPLEDCYMPHQFPGTKIAENEFYQIGKWLCENPINGFILETMNNLTETKICLEVVSKFNLPIWLSYYLADAQHICSGEPLISAIKLAKKYSVECLLINCNPLDITMNSMDIIIKNWDRKWGVYPNLGIGVPDINGIIDIIHTNDKFLSIMELALDGGANILGACCGSSPKHIALLKNTFFD